MCGSWTGVCADFLIIWRGETVRPCNRGRLGIVIILSPVARLAWEARGELVRKNRVGRVMTLDLALEGQRTLRLGSAYFPTTGTSSDERRAFYDEMPLTLNPRKEGSRSRVHWRNEQGADARNKTHKKRKRKKRRKIISKHTLKQPHIARARLFSERGAAFLPSFPKPLGEY